MIKDAIVIYTCLYIKHVRTRGYNKSLYSFVKQFESNSYFCILTYKISNELVRKHYLNRISRQKYIWNTEGKILLRKDLKRLIKNCI